MALLLFFLCVFFFVFFSRTDRFFNLSCHLFSYPLSLKQTSSFRKIFFFFWIFSKNKEREKIICSFFVFAGQDKFWATFVDQSKVVSLHLMYKWDLSARCCLWIHSFVLCFFFSLCVIWVLWTFQLWNCYRTGVRCYICNLCCTYGSGCLYIILCRTALKICGIHLRSNNRDNICLYCLQLRLLDTSFFVVFFFFCS